MDKAFLTIYSKLRLFVYMQDDAQKLKTKNEIKTMLHKWIVKLKATSPDMIALFVDMNNASLLLFKEMLLHPELAFRSLHDQLFTKMLQLNPKPPALTTRLFTDFIAGISWFSHQDQGKRIPIYHRLASCGPGTDAFRNAFNQCHDALSRQERNENKSRIERCYIERLVYNEIYKQVELFLPGESRSQDPGHLHWINNEVKDDFKSCFPNVELDIQVVFKKFLHVEIPICLIITRSVKGSHTSVIKYNKVASQLRDGSVKYNAETECVRTVYSGKNVSRWFKLQTFDQEVAKWMRIK